MPTRGGRRGRPRTNTNSEHNSRITRARRSRLSAVTAESSASGAAAPPPPVSVDANLPSRSTQNVQGNGQDNRREFSNLVQELQKAFANLEDIARAIPPALELKDEQTQMVIISRRGYNLASFRMKASQQRLLEVPLPNGNALPEEVSFPKSVQEFRELDEGQVRALLDVYGLEAPETTDEVRATLQTYITTA